MAPAGNRFYHDLSPEFTSSSGTFIGGELYISKVGQSGPQVSKMGIFPQFSRQYVRLRRTMFEQVGSALFWRFLALFLPMNCEGT
jgi:hypothetical protein